MIIRAKTFDKWILANLKDNLQDIVNHGADAGYPGITYYQDTVKLYDKFNEEIWNCLDKDTAEFGYKTIPEFIATFNRADVADDTQFKNLLVWYYIERFAHNLYP